MCLGIPQEVASNPRATPVPFPPMPAPMTPSDSGGEYEEPKSVDAKRAGRESDGDYSESGMGHAAARKRKDSHTKRTSLSAAKKKRRVVEDEDDNDDIEQGKADLQKSSSKGEVRLSSIV